MYGVKRFDPAPARLSEGETRSILGFRWWRAGELTESADTIYPPQLGRLLAGLLNNGVPAEPIAIGEQNRAASD